MIVRHNRHRMPTIKFFPTFPRCLVSLLLLSGMLLPCASYAQMSSIDTAAFRMINIKGDTLKGFKGDTVSYQRILGSVVITHENGVMTCDSAHFYLEQNRVEAYSNVHLTHPNGTTAQSDYLQYTGADHMALMNGNVQIRDAKNTLYTESIQYNLKTKIGNYTDGGTLQSDETTVSSQLGTYNGTSKQAYFKTDVIITNPKYIIESKELTYNTASKVIKFLDESHIMGETDTVHTTAGEYDSKNEKAFFTKRTTLLNKEQVISGNTLQYDEKTGYGHAKGRVEIAQNAGKNLLFADETEYNKKTGYGKATGNVVLIDTAQHSRLLSGMIEYNDHSKFMLATLHPKLITLTDKDSLYMRADTMMLIRNRDLGVLKYTSITQGEKKKKQTFQAYNLLYADSTFISNDSLRLIIANHQVRMFSDSMQAVCDSLSYSQIDSSFRLFRSPIIWNRNQQGTADTIWIQTERNTLEQVNLRANSFLVSQNASTCYDQVSGNYIDAYFKDGEMDWAHVNQNAESLYYAKDDKGAYIGVNKAECSMMRIYFVNKELDHIVMLENPKGTFYPIDQIADKEKYLSAFKLFPERRPASKAEIMNNE